MNKGILIIGALIFAIYLYFLFSNIYRAHEKQKENHYPDLTKEDIFEEYREANQD